MKLQPPSAPDPFTLTEIIGGGYYDYNSKSVRSTQLNVGIRNLVIITAGQSNIANEANTLYTPTYGSVIDNFCIGNGGMYSTADPLLGCTQYAGHDGSAGGNVAGRIADYFIGNSIFDRVILVPTAITATSVAHWANGQLANRLPVTIARLSSQNIKPSRATFILLWGQGEADSGITSQSAYAASLSTVISNVQNAGFSGRIFIAKQTWNQYGYIDSGIQNAQHSVVDNITVFDGPNADSMDGSYRQSDNVHFSDPGVSLYATNWCSAIHGTGYPF
jgi:hypothetical protein